MKLPKGIKLIEVNNIKVLEKDEIEVSDIKDFVTICKTQGFKEVFRKRYETSCEFSDYYYLIGTEVMYIYHEQLKKEAK